MSGALAERFLVPCTPAPHLVRRRARLVVPRETESGGATELANEKRLKRVPAHRRYVTRGRCRVIASGLVPCWSAGRAQRCFVAAVLPIRTILLP